MNKLKFTRASGDWRWKSDCGKYSVWLQGEPLDGSKEWAAQYLDERPWLCALAGWRSEAQEICQDHADKLAGKNNASENEVPMPKQKQKPIDRRATPECVHKLFSSGCARREELNEHSKRVLGRPLLGAPTDDPALYAAMAEIQAFASLVSREDLAAQLTNFLKRCVYGTTTAMANDHTLLCEDDNGRQSWAFDGVSERDHAHALTGKAAAIAARAERARREAAGAEARPDPPCTLAEEHHVSFLTSSWVAEQLKRLAATGMYGADMNSVAEELLRAKLREIAT